VTYLLAGWNKNAVKEVGYLRYNTESAFITINALWTTWAVSRDSRLWYITGPKFLKR